MQSIPSKQISMHLLSINNSQHYIHSPHRIHQVTIMKVSVPAVPGLSTFFLFFTTDTRAHRNILVSQTSANTTLQSTSKNAYDKNELSMATYVHMKIVQTHSHIHSLFKTGSSNFTLPINYDP